MERNFLEEERAVEASYNPNMMKLANALLSFSNPGSPVSAAISSTLKPAAPQASTTSASTGGSQVASSKSMSGSPSHQDSGEVRAFAKLQGRNWTYYVQKVSVLIGKRMAEDPMSEVDVDLGLIEEVSRKHLRIDYAGPNGWEMYCFGKSGVSVDGQHYEAFCQPIVLGAKSLISVGGVDFYFLLPIGIYSSVSKPEGAELGSDDHHHQQHHHQQQAQRDQGFAGRSRSVMEQQQPHHYQCDEPMAAKPYVSYACLIAEAINSSSEARLTLSDIYKYLMDKYPYFRQTKNGWQNSIRHNLSLNKAFMKIPRSGGEPGKGMFWVIDPNHKHLVEGKGYQRRLSAAAKHRNASLNAGAGFAPYAHPMGTALPPLRIPPGGPGSGRPSGSGSQGELVHLPVRAMSTISIPRNLLTPSSSHNMLLEAAEALENGDCGGGEDAMEEPASAPDRPEQRGGDGQGEGEEEEPFHPQPSRPFVFSDKF